MQPPLDPSEQVTQRMKLRHSGQYARLHHRMLEQKARVAQEETHVTQELPPPPRNVRMDEMETYRMPTMRRRHRHRWLSIGREVLIALALLGDLLFILLLLFLVWLLIFAK